MNTKLHLMWREPCEPRVILHKRRHALDLRTNLQQQAFTLSPKTVLPRRVQSQTALWSWHNTPSMLTVVVAGKGACSLFLYLATSSLLGRMADTHTHWAPANTHAHRLNVCSTAKRTHSHTANAPSFSTVVTTPSTSKLQSDKSLLGTPRRSPQIHNVF